MLKLKTSSLLSTGFIRIECAVGSREEVSSVGNFSYILAVLEPVVRYKTNQRMDKMSLRKIIDP